MRSNNSRTSNTLFNFMSSIGGQLIRIVLQFVIRTVFINTLGQEYLGITGLFSNILYMLSLAELGVGSAIIFKLYQPLATHDTNRLVVLMKFYKRVYTAIGLVVAAIGLLLIPFLPVLISDYVSVEKLGINVALIFCLYLFNSVSSYLFFAYKSAIVKADQKEYILNFVGYAVEIIVTIVQIAELLILRNFELYVVSIIFGSILTNLVNAFIAKRMYPFIDEKTDDNISIQECKEIFKDCAAIFLYKINGVVLKATDNIVLSAFMGLRTVALYSNYYVLYSAINTIFTKIFNSVSHSLGNLHVYHDVKKEYNVFRTVNLVTAIMGGTACVGIMVVSDEFISSWIGKEWVLNQPFSFLMGLELFTLANRSILSKYRTTMGLFQQAKFRPIISIFVNLFVSIALVRCWGICGVLVGTILADWSVMMWLDPLIIHNIGFQKQFSVFLYYKRMIKYIFIIITMCIVNKYICSHAFVGLGWISVIIHALICAVSVPLVLLLGSMNTYEGRAVVRLIKQYLKKMKILKG